MNNRNLATHIKIHFESARQRPATFAAANGLKSFAIDCAVSEFGTDIDRALRFIAVGKQGLALFGALDLQNGYKNDGRGMALGFRHSNDKALAPPSQFRVLSDLGRAFGFGG